MSQDPKRQDPKRARRQWADKYGARWYLHRDGKPPHDDDGDYYWTGTQWCPEWMSQDADNLDLDEFEENKRRKIAERNEY